MNIPIDISNVVLKTDRLTLRRWRESDLADFYEYAKVDGVGQMAGWSPHKDLDESRKILSLFIDEKKTFAIEYNGKAIGSVGVEKYKEAQFPQLDNVKCRELGYVLNKDYWGMGIMPEAVNRIIDYLFENTDADAVLCGHFLWNKQSRRVQEKCGFEYLATGPYITTFGKEETEKMNILTREKWEKSKKSGG